MARRHDLYYHTVAPPLLTWEAPSHEGTIKSIPSLMDLHAWHDDARRYSHHLPELHEKLSDMDRMFWGAGMRDERYKCYYGETCALTAHMHSVKGGTSAGEYSITEAGWQGGIYRAG